MAAETTRLRTWKVEGTIPYKPPNGGRGYAKNLNLEVFALTLEEVVQAVRKRYPDITLYAIKGDRWAESVIVVDPGGKGEPPK